MGRRVVLLFLAFTVLFVVAWFVDDGGNGVNNAAGSIGSNVKVVYFYGEGCPHCARVKPLIDGLESRGVRVQRFEVFVNRDNLRLLNEYFERFNVPVADRGVPAVFIGDSYLVGVSNYLALPALILAGSMFGLVLTIAYSSRHIGKALPALPLQVLFMLLAWLFGSLFIG